MFQMTTTPKPKNIFGAFELNASTNRSKIRRDIVPEGFPLNRLISVPYLGILILLYVQSVQIDVLNWLLGQHPYSA